MPLRVWGQAAAIIFIIMGAFVAAPIIGTITGIGISVIILLNLLLWMNSDSGEE